MLIIILIISSVLRCLILVPLLPPLHAFHPALEAFYVFNFDDFWAFEPMNIEYECTLFPLQFLLAS